ncbi:hypothetical protein DO021_17345 [Desulfobacter hydrogenophilus]|uniref:Uncharacterized protein n=1 Tax=Desulfobacter hydrogenophilus TaxID=2291 RepID=A0A328F7T8_9BACT|nr:hypothetical protein [Desulfobacter hydrogenophilus]NDY73406.1 hypothetical protein [Desulfobacter hydrogenophilus]QBH12427.1 hypothetical protein EYB58_05585 [Desulfobacter hydrogenophilus]RAM00734.1 hypothetical protein DO021_17345 [Desulfobacter hydrogenophilus]
MPYMTGFVKDVENPLFLRKFAVPFWALSHCFGKNPMYLYRLLVLAQLCGKLKKSLQPFSDDVNDFIINWVAHVAFRGLVLIQTLSMSND